MLLGTQMADLRTASFEKECPEQNVRGGGKENEAPGKWREPHSLHKNNKEDTQSRGKHLIGQHAESKCNLLAQRYLPGCCRFVHIEIPGPGAYSAEIHPRWPVQNTQISALEVTAIRPSTFFVSNQVQRRITALKPVSSL